MPNLVSAQDLKRQLASDAAPLVIDVRGDDEFAAGHVPGAVHIPLDQLESKLEELPRDKPIVTYCTMRHRGSSRGEKAAELLQAHGFDASALDGGLPGYQAAASSSSEQT